MSDGFFNKFMKDVEKAIKENFNDGAILEVRHVKRAMGISSKNRSKTAFISRALDKLSRNGLLKYLGRATTKRYKINKDGN
ncbi:MAG: hypothetical protein ACFFCS_09670 [Candidatus Hodarchaeota archaeon]